MKTKTRKWGRKKEMTAAFKYKKTDAKSLFPLGQTGPGAVALNYKEKSV